MFNKALKRVLAGATVAAVCTLGVPALPALATPSAPTLSVSTVDDWNGTATSGYTTIAGSQLFLHFETKNLSGNGKNIQVGFTRLTGSDESVYVEDGDGNDWGWIDNGDNNTSWGDYTWNVGSNNVESEYRIAADDAATVRVEAYLDNDDSGTFTTGDVAMADKVVTFVKTQDAGLKVALKTPQDNRAVVASLTSTNADLNLASLDGNNFDDANDWWGVDSGWDNIPTNYPWVEVKESRYENTNDGFVSFDTYDFFDWNTSSKELTAELNDATENYYYQSQLWYYNYNDETDYKIGGTASVKAGPDIEGSITDITDVTATASANVNPDGTDVEVRTGTKTVVVTGKATGAVAGSHVAVRPFNSEGSYADYTVDGTKLDGDPVLVAVKADGTFSFTVTTIDATVDDYLDLRVAQVDNAFSGSNFEDVYLYWNAASPVITMTNTNLNNSSDIALLDREVYTANLELKDQFGQYLTDATYKAKYTSDGVADDVTFTGGKASISVSFRSSSSNTFIHFTELDKNSGSISYDTDFNLYNSSEYYIDFEVRDKNYATFKLTEDENDTYVDPSGQALVNGATLTSWDDAIDFSSYVDTVDGSNAKYAKVTYSAPGLAFVVNDKVYLNSVTVNSDVNGYSWVYVLGNKTGDYTLTASSGTDSYTETIHVNGSSLAPASVKVLDSQTSELSVRDNGTDTYVWATFKFFDKFGNPTDNHNLNGSIVGDDTISVSDFDTWDQSEGNGYKGDGKDYYQTAYFYVKDSFSGTKTLKITSGSFSYSLPLVIGAPNVTVSAPAAVKAGTAAVVTITAKDANGDPIARDEFGYHLNEAYAGLYLTGPAYMAYTSSEWRNFDDKGQLTYTIVTTAGQTGNVGIIGSYQSSCCGNYWFNDQNDNTVFKEYKANVAVVLAVPTAKVTGKNLTVKYSYAAGKKVVLKVDGKVKYSGKPASNKLVSVTKALAKGNHTVVLTIGSLTVVNKVVSVK